MSKYCCYHHENEHDTNNFRALKDEIEQLIRRGQVKDLEHGQNARQNQPQRQAPVQQEEVVQE